MSCSTADFKNNYAKKLYDKALEKAGDDIYDLELSCVLDLSADDYIEVYVQTDGSSIALTSLFGYKLIT